MTIDINTDFADCAWLHRRGKPSWLFRYDEERGRLAHTTRYGKTYVIVASHACNPFFKPLWIAEVIEKEFGCSIVNAEQELRARSIEFACGGSYSFPPRPKRGRYRSRKL